MRNYCNINRLFVAALAIAVVSTVVGCGGKPKGFPSVKPCTITVVDGGAGIEGVEVALVPSATLSGTIIGGKTDASGACVVTTTFANYRAPGAPAGEYTVQLQKNPDVGMPDLTPEQMETMERGDIDKYYADRAAKVKSAEKIVPPNLTSFQTSPIKVNVPNDATVTVDLSQYK